MKKFKKSKIALFALTLISSFFIAKADAYAIPMTPDEIPASSYVIGKYVFTREKNEETGYNGVLTTNLLMLASKSIESDDLDDMKIYYKLASGNWIEGATGEELEAPESFDVSYIDLQKDELEFLPQKPLTPILISAHNPSYFDGEYFGYEVEAILDICELDTPQIDGIEVIHYINGREEKEDIDLDTLEACFRWEGPEEDLPEKAQREFEKLTIGRLYNSTTIEFANAAVERYSISVRTYVEDTNGERIYSDNAIYSAENFPAIEIVNNYSNPKYIAENEKYYVYNLEIKKPYQYAFQGNNASLGYIVYEESENSTRQIGIFKLKEKFTISVEKGTIKKYYAKLGYYNADGDFVMAGSVKDYFTIDTRKLTAPVLSLGEQTYGTSNRLGEEILFNKEFYNSQAQDTLDYKIKGLELYRVVSNWEETIYEMVSDSSSSSVLLKPSTGVSYYAARVYAINDEGETVYSDFSDLLGVVRTPRISVSEIIDGKATVTIDNIDEYSASGFTFTLYKTSNETGSDVKLEEINYQKGQEAKFEIDALEDMEIYAVASHHDWENSSGLDPIDMYSQKSNIVGIVLE